MLRRISSTILFVAVAHTLTVAQLIPANLKIRVEKADRISPPTPKPGPSNCYRGKDNYFNEIEIAAGTFYGYTANGNIDRGPGTVNSTCYITGNHVYNMGGSFDNQFAIASGDPKTFSSAYASCGYWLNGTYKSGTTYYGFAHAEGYGTPDFGRVCNYPPTTKSMGLLTSTNGTTWTPQGQILANPTAQNSGGSEYGEGDCTPVPFAGYLYLYCRRVQDTQTSVARSLLTSGFGQSSWTKYLNGSWNGTWQSDDSSLGLYGSSSSIFANYGNVTLLRSELGGTTIHGVTMSFSNNSDATTFTSVPDPILYEDAYQYPNGSSASDLIAYPSALSGTDGSRIWNGYFLLTYTFVPNSNDLRGAPDNGRTLVMRNVTVSQQSSAQSPQVGIALSRWYSSSIGQRVSTVEVVPYNYVSAGYTLETSTGYVMSVPPVSGSKTLVECVSTANYPNSTNPDHLVNSFDSSSTPTNKGCDANYAFLRTAGYLYAASQGSSTEPLYRCKPGVGINGTTNSHFVSLQSDCEGKGGGQEYSLGYALVN